jgi:hypothetical protein
MRDDSDLAPSPLQLLIVQLGSFPMTPLGIVADYVISLHLNPLEDRMLLLLCYGQELLDPESLGRRYGRKGVK